jgi:hypothetical protein
MITIAIVAAAFVASVTVGVIGFVRAGIVREERDQSLLDIPATRSAVATRRLIGLYVRSPRYPIEVDEATTAQWPAHRPSGRPRATGQYR